MKTKLNENFFNEISGSALLSRRETAVFLEQKGVPQGLGDRLYSFTRGEPHLTAAFAESYDSLGDGLEGFRREVCSLYASLFAFGSLGEMQLLHACSLAGEVPFPLMPRLAWRFRQSSFQISQKSRIYRIFFEESGSYILFPFFQEFLAGEAERHLTESQMLECRQILLEEILGGGPFRCAFLSLAEGGEKAPEMEALLVREIKEKGVSHLEEQLLKLEPRQLTRVDLRVLLMLLGILPASPGALKVLMGEVTGSPLYPELRRRYWQFLGRRLLGPPPFRHGRVTGGEEEEWAYLRGVEAWRLGAPLGKPLPESCYGRYGFLHVPEALLYEAGYEGLLREEGGRLNSCRRRLTAAYLCFLQGEIRRGERLLSWLARHDQDILAGPEKPSWILLLAHLYFSAGKPALARKKLEELLEGQSSWEEGIFLLKIMTLYQRILMDGKDHQGLLELEERCRRILPPDKPFAAFMGLLEASVRILAGEDPAPVLAFPLEYSMAIGDEVSAVQLYSYALSGDGKGKDHLLKVQESLLDQEKMAIYHHTSLVEGLRPVPLCFNFFGPLAFKVGEQDCSQPFLARKKLRKIMAYLIFSHPIRVSREELKRIFWDRDKSFDLDANLRVAISSIRKLLASFGIGDLLLCGEGKVSLNSRYQVRNDYRSYLSVYRRACFLYEEGQAGRAEGFFRQVLRVLPEEVFPDVAWDYLEKRVRRKVKGVREASLQIMAELAGKKGAWGEAEDFFRLLHESSGCHGGALAACLRRNGKEEEADRLEAGNPLSRPPLETIFFPD